MSLVDVLSDVLHVVRLTSARFFRFDFASPWSVSSPARPEMARVLGVTQDRFLGFHVIVEGSCWVTVEGMAPYRLAMGDVAVFPHGVAHVMYDDPHLQPLPVASLLPPEPWDDLPLIRRVGASAGTRLLCGYLQFDQRFDPLAGSLPRLLHVRTSDQHGAATPDLPGACGEVRVQPGDRLGATLRHMVEEVTHCQPGTMAVIARLGELLYVEVLRRYMIESPPQQANWLAAVNDPDVGQVLRLIHAEPHRDWTVEGLAREVGVSAFASGTALRRACGAATHEVPGRVARSKGDADAAAVRCEHPADRRTGGIWVRGGLLPGVQAGCRATSRDVAAHRRCGRFLGPLAAYPRSPRDTTKRRE